MFVDFKRERVIISDVSEPSSVSRYWSICIQVLLYFLEHFHYVPCLIWQSGTSLCILQKDEVRQRGEKTFVKDCVGVIGIGSCDVALQFFVPGPRSFTVTWFFFHLADTLPHDVIVLLWMVVGFVVVVTGFWQLYFSSSVVVVVKTAGTWTRT